MRRSGGGSLFHARGPAAAKDRSPRDDIVRGTATELDAADLRPGLTVAAADGVIRSGVTLKLGVGGVQGHWKWRRLIRLSICPPL